jgi:hypothetical protein
MRFLNLKTLLDATLTILKTTGPKLRPRRGVVLEQDQPADELVAKTAPQIEPAVAHLLNQNLRRRGQGGRLETSTTGNPKQD